MSSTVLSLSDVSVEYALENSRVLALDNVNVDVPSSGYTLGIVGESGSGKTTLGMCIMRLIEPPGKIVRGRIEYRGKNVLEMRRELLEYRGGEVSMVFQSAMNSLSPTKKISDHIIEVITEHHATRSKREARTRAIELLTEVGIPKNRVDSYPHELSGGMKQRVMIAMSLALSPKLLIADEPTSALDVVVQRQVLSLLKKEVSKRGLSLIFITHELALLGGLVENIAVMFRGEIIERGRAEDILLHPKHPYTEMLLDSLLTVDKNAQRIFGSDPSSDSLLQFHNSNYCKYVGRCKYAFNRCREERPILKETEPGRLVACHKYN
jgi:oligopeptide/dipeptide ABC transporter ATP-binding protein